MPRLVIGRARHRLNTMPETQEQKARHDIDAKLTASGWLVQDREDLDLTANRGLAVRDFAMKLPRSVCRPASGIRLA